MLSSALIRCFTALLILSFALIGCFTVLLNVELGSDWLLAHQQQGNTGRKIYIFKYILLQLYRRVIILYIKRGHQGAVINTRGIETAFERSIYIII